MTNYRVIVDGEQDGFSYAFDGEPQINLTFEHRGTVYKVVTRAHDLHESLPTIHAEVI